jgi:Tfp pilus assembly protein PilE
MKNQLLKLRKAEGFVSIETIMVAAIMVLAGLVAYNVLYAGILEDKVTAARGDLLTNTADAEEVFNMGLDLGD